MPQKKTPGQKDCLPGRLSCQPCEAAPASLHSDSTFEHRPVMRRGRAPLLAPAVGDHTARSRPGRHRKRQAESRRLEPRGTSAGDKAGVAQSRRTSSTKSAVGPASHAGTGRSGARRRNGTITHPGEDKSMKKGPGPRRARIGQAASIVRIGPTPAQARRDSRERREAEDEFRRRRLENPQREEADRLAAKILEREGQR